MSRSEKYEMKDRHLRQGLEALASNFFSFLEKEIRHPETLEVIRVRSMLVEFGKKNLPDLRTIRLMKTLMTSLPDEFDKAFEQMATQVNRMQLLADDLILLSQFEADGQTTNRNPINLNNLLCEIIVEAEQLSSGKHSLHLNCPDSLSITSEMSAVRSALGNIVFNAVRHNSQGATIRISVVESAETVSVAIADDGVGIDPLEIPRLTERFYRGDSSRNSTTGGSGLGLAIAKHAMTRCEGSLQINSSLGEGSEFTCRFPVL